MSEKSWWACSSDKMQLQPDGKPKAKIKIEYIQVLMLVIGLVCCSSLKLSVTYVNLYGPWSSEDNATKWFWFERSFIVERFYWGYLVTQIPGALLAQRWSASKVLAIAIGFSGLASLAIPLAAASKSYYLVYGYYLLTGLLQGAVPGCLHTLLARWLPQTQRGRAASLIGVSVLVCDAITMALMFDDSLGSYVWPVVTVIWTLVWVFLASDSPAEDPLISSDERLYIQSSLGMVQTSKRISVPWTSILFSCPVWALIITQTCQTLAMQTIANFNLTFYTILDGSSRLGLFWIPLVFFGLINFFVSFEKLIGPEGASLQCYRKLCNTIGQLMPALALAILLNVQNYDSVLYVSLYTIIILSCIFVYAGHYVNHIDLSPNFAGLIMGITNTVAIACTLLETYAIHTDLITRSWLAIIYWVIGGIVFLFWGSSKVQSWNDPDSKNVISETP